MYRLLCYLSWALDFILLLPIPFILCLNFFRFLRFSGNFLSFFQFEFIFIFFSNTNTLAFFCLFCKLSSYIFTMYRQLCSLSRALDIVLLLPIPVILYRGGGWFFGFLMYCTVSEDAGIEPRTVATSALTVRRSYHSARSHPQLASIFFSPFF
jgi:hypothetical protein